VEALRVRSLAPARGDLARIAARARILYERMASAAGGTGAGDGAAGRRAARWAETAAKGDPGQFRRRLAEDGFAETGLELLLREEPAAEDQA